jgi:type IV secretion system protein VirB10
MRLNRSIPERFNADATQDPREGQSAEIIDLATRNVLPSVTQRKPKTEGLGMVAGILAVAGLGAVTLWSMDSARTAQPAAGPAQQPAPAHRCRPCSWSKAPWCRWRRSLRQAALRCRPRRRKR